MTNNVDHNVPDANFHIYADDTVLYCTAATPHQHVSQLQLPLNIVQNTFYDLKLYLNSYKTKLMLFEYKIKITELSITTSRSSQSSSVSQYECLGILPAKSVSFTPTFSSW